MHCLYACVCVCVCVVGDMYIQTCIINSCVTTPGMKIRFQCLMPSCSLRHRSLRLRSAGPKPPFLLSSSRAPLSDHRHRLDRRVYGSTWAECAATRPAARRDSDSRRPPALRGARLSARYPGRMRSDGGRPSK